VVKGAKVYFGTSKKPHEVVEFREHPNKKSGVATLRGPTGKLTKALKTIAGKYKKMK
jgi:hypothetical protein